MLFDDIWQRPALNPRERSLITVAALVALNRVEQLPFHLQLAQRNGVTRQQLAELITHLAFYAGWPRRRRPWRACAIWNRRPIMPFSRIALHQGKSADYLQTLSDSLHQALVEAFEVPPTDKFQVIDQYRPGELIYDRDYLGGPRSADFVLFYITAGRPRDTDTKRRFYGRLAALLAENLRLRGDVMVVITTTQLDEWSFSAGRASMIDPQT